MKIRENSVSRFKESAGLLGRMRLLTEICIMTYAFLKEFLLKYLMKIKGREEYLHNTMRM